MAVLTTALTVAVCCLMAGTSAKEPSSIEDFRNVTPSIDAKKKSNGLLLEAPPSYIDFTGKDGLELEISLPSTGPFDYTVMFWFRSVKSYKQLSADDSIKDG